MATPNTSPYTVSKHGVVGFTRALAVELGRWGGYRQCCVSRARFALR